MNSATGFSLRALSCSTSRSYSFKTFFPTGVGITNTDFALLALNALFLGAGVFANLGFETIGLDLYVVALLAFISAYLLYAMAAADVCVLHDRLCTGARR